MEAPSAPAHRGFVLWKEFLLAVSLLTFWSLPTTARLTIESTNATEGEDVLLLAHSLPENLISYSWYKGERVDSNHQIATYIITLARILTGPAHSGRETIYTNGSLLFQKVTLNDTGHYTVQAITKDTQTEVASGQLCVYTPVGKPSIRARNTTVTEHKDTMVMTCLTNDTGISIHWFFRDQRLLLTNRMNLSQDNSTLIIEPVRREDAGGYQCEVSNPISTSKSDPHRLDVQKNDYTGYSARTITSIVIGGILVVVALGTSLGCFLYCRRTRRARDKRGLTKHRPPAPTPGQGPSGTSISPGPLPGTRTSGPIYEDLLHPSTDVYCRISPRADGAS
ncbi:carcinoembryonic antigen-related cell adhesion molecule 21-like isoform X2 [Phyllostomus hastatus]|uniref:carcinoembryonic antigen-related cell adhesion molecule 21-like isoform X2 n=1 Tax=Phyllostomus hastatus TaxID=9423 RepID=UPI001E68338C|nr:carcinoembryonic antigen-related cell adhesion molecule 21-like isoform X2 [Phyllostomus hastatus]